MSRQLPPLAWLQAFEATARHSSFTRAASELNLSQTAISHRIRKLENLLGLKLFIREGNTVTLTDIASDYLASTRSAIAEILIATDRVHNHRRGDILTIAAPGTFAIKCLIPNLPKFRAAHSNIVFRLRTLVPYARRQPEHDVAIQYGVGDWPRRKSERICSEEVFPVCSPKLLRGRNGLKTPEDLQHHTIIRVVSPLIQRDEWPQWLEAAGAPHVRFGCEVSCDLLYPSFEAAIAGLGVVLGRSTVVKRDLEAGLLVEPFKTRLPSPMSYYLTFTTAAERAKRPIITEFRNWLIELMNS